jgi:hypothetical protein
MTRALTLLYASAVLLLGGCNDATGPERSQLAAAEARWRNARPASNSYVMRQQVACFCPFGPNQFDVTVVNGAVTAATIVGPTSAHGPILLSSFRTIDQLFDEIRAALDKPGTLTHVSYDSQRGFPTEVSLDRISNAADDEVSYVTVSVVAMP